MPERDPFVIEPESAQRPPTTRGDRLMVGLAAAALLAGLGVALGNLLPVDDEVSRASPTSVSTVSTVARPTASSHPLGQILVTPVTAEPTPTPRPGDDLSYFYVRPVVALTVRADPTDDGQAMGVVEPGDVVLATDSSGARSASGWLHVFDPRPFGWIRIVEGPRPLADVYPAARPDRGQPGPLARQDPEVTVLRAVGDHGFLGTRFAADGSFSFVTSADGAAWSVATSTPALSAARDVELNWPEFGQGPLIADGPAGWLAAGQLFWRSSDGASWEALGALGDGEQWPIRLQGSSRGYLMATNFRQPDNSLPGLGWWYSTNGTLWSEMSGWEPATDLLWSFGVTLAAGDLGFYAWDRRSTGELDGARGPAGAFTSDGIAWQTIDEGPVGSAARVVFLEDRLLGMDVEPATGAIRTWTGFVRGGVLAWDEPRELPELAGHVIAFMVGDGRHAVAMTWDRLTEEISTWATEDGASWEPAAALAGGWSTIPHAAFGSRAGLLVADGLTDAADPRLWKLDGDEWREIRSAVLGSSAGPPEPCPGPPRDGLDFVLLDPMTGLRCFGDATLTFRAYAISCLACERFRLVEPWEPAWLAPPARLWHMPGQGESARRSIFLAPYETYSTAFAATMLAESLTFSDAWADQWVEVAGHFDDPASKGCRQILDEISSTTYLGRAADVATCRLAFVVTDVTLVDDA